MKNLSEHIPLYCAAQNILLSKWGDLTVAYAVELPEIFTLSNTDYATIHQSWVKAFKILPAGVYLHKQDWFIEKHFAGGDLAEPTFLGHSSARYFNERPYLSHECRLMLSFPAQGHQPGNSYHSSLLRKHTVPLETIDPAFTDRVNGICSQFARILCDTGFVACTRLDDAALVNLVNEYLLLGKDGLRRDLDFSDGLRVGEKYCSLFSLGDVHSLSSVCGPRISFDKYSTDSSKFPVGFVSPLCQLLPVNHLYQQFIRIEDGGSLKQRLERKKLRLQSLSAYSRDNAVGKQGVEAFLQEAASGEKQIVRAHFHVLAWTDDPTKVQEVRNQCSAALAVIDASPKLETVGAAQLFWAGIPGNAADLPSNETFLTFSEQAACFLNTETGYRSANGSFGIRLGERIQGKPVMVDISDEPLTKGVITNRNKFILGPSGSGKSFFTNHLLRSYYEQGTHIVLVDVGHSYKGLCELVGGIYFSYSDSEPICFNPFSGTPDAERKESIKTLLVALWKKDDEGFSRSEYVALSNALQGYYEKSVAVRGFDSFYEYLSDVYVQVVKADGVKDKDFDLKNFLYVLRPFYKGGEYDYLLNATEKKDLLAKRFIVFELDNIKDHPILLPVVTIIIMEVFLSKLRQLKGVRKMILIEEAWKAIMREGMAEYIKYLYKTVRKHFGEAVVVTQDVEDIVSSPIVKQAIINNSDCKILMDQAKYENKFNVVQELLGLTEKERTLVLSMNRANDPILKYKEVFISLGGRQSKVYRVEVSPEEYLTYTTEENEKLRVAESAAKCGSMEAGIGSLVNGESNF